jgi:hypothetical protein
MRVPKLNNPPADGDEQGYSARKPWFVTVILVNQLGALVVVAVLLWLVRVSLHLVLRMPHPLPQNRLQFPLPLPHPKLVPFPYR